MTSKKKKMSRSKGKKTVKKLDGKEEGQQQGTIVAQMERLMVDEDSQTNADEDALLEEAIKLAAAEKEALGCCHGYDDTAADIDAFTKTFVSDLCSGDDLIAATAAIRVCTGARSINIPTCGMKLRS